MKPLNSSKSHRLLDLVPSVKPLVVSVILVFVCGVLLGEEWNNKRTADRIRISSTVFPALRVARLKILTWWLFHRQKIAQYFLLEFEFRGKSCVEWKHGGEDGISCLLPCIIIVYRVNLNKLPRNLVVVLRTTTTNCRVSFIDLYLVFPRNFRIVFLPHTNTVILLKDTVVLSQSPGVPVLTSDCLQQFTLLSDWNQKEKTQQSFVVQEVVWGLRKESIEHETF